MFLRLNLVVREGQDADNPHFQRNPDLMLVASFPVRRRSL